MTQLLSVPSRHAELFFFGCGSTMLLLAFVFVFWLRFENPNDILVFISALIASALMLYRGFSSRAERMARLDEVQRLEQSISTAVNF